jgi:hypothetical protein
MTLRRLYPLGSSAGNDAAWEGQPDPAFRGKPVTVIVMNTELDHLYPLNRILNDPGLSRELKKLSVPQRISVADCLANLFVVNENVNASRQNKLYSEYSYHGTLGPLDAKWLDDMNARAVSGLNAIYKFIFTYQQANKGEMEEDFITKPYTDCQ